MQGSEGPLPCTDAGRYCKSDQSEAAFLKKSPQAHTNVGMANEMGVAWGSGSAGGALQGSCPRVHCFHLSPLSSSPEWPAARGGVGSLRWGPETEAGKSHSLRWPPPALRQVDAWPLFLESRPSCCLLFPSPRPSVQGCRPQHAWAFPHPSQELTAPGGWTLPEGLFGTASAPAVKCQGLQKC